MQPNIAVTIHLLISINSKLVGVSWEFHGSFMGDFVTTSMVEAPPQVSKNKTLKCLKWSFQCERLKRNTPTLMMKENIFLLLVLLSIPFSHPWKCGHNPLLDPNLMTAEQNPHFIFDFLDNAGDITREYQTQVLSDLPRDNNHNNFLFLIFLGKGRHRNEKNV